MPFICGRRVKCEHFCWAFILLLLILLVLALNHNNSQIQSFEVIVLPFAQRQPFRIEILSKPRRVIDLCHNKLSTPVLLVLINSLPDDFSIRAAIRRTWAQQGNNINSGYEKDINGDRQQFLKCEHLSLTNLFNRVTFQPDFLFAFVTGVADSRLTASLLDLESYRFGDLILTNITENFYNLPLKTGTMLVWSEQHCPRIKCLLKTDSDVITRPAGVVNLCRNRTKSILNTAKIYGSCWLDAPVLHNETNYKRLVPKQVYNGTTYPLYCSGSAYLMTMPAVKRLIAHIPKRPWPTDWPRNTPEDVTFTGLIADAANVSRFNVKGFYQSAAETRNLTRERKCLDRRILTVHGYENKEEIEEQWSKWAELHCL